jgi:hypothetical protein
MVFMDPGLRRDDRVFMSAPTSYSATPRASLLFASSDFGLAVFGAHKDTTHFSKQSPIPSYLRVKSTGPSSSASIAKVAHSHAQ